MNENIPHLATIRETARMGVLSEHRLRCMEKQGLLPCIHAGNRCLINIDMLVKQLNDLSKEKEVATE